MIHGLIKVLRLLTNRHKQREIMYTSPYRAQCDRIRDLLREQDLFKVHVRKFRSTMSREAPIVIANLTTCKLRESRGVGFITERTLLNLATSRARFMMIIIGDLAILDRRPNVTEEDNMPWTLHPNLLPRFLIPGSILFGYKYFPFLPFNFFLLNIFNNYPPNMYLSPPLY